VLSTAIGVKYRARVLFAFIANARCMSGSRPTSERGLRGAGQQAGRRQDPAVLPRASDDLNGHRHPGPVDADRNADRRRAGQARGQREDKILARDLPVPRRGLARDRGQQEVDVLGGFQVPVAEAVPVPQLAIGLLAGELSPAQ